MEKCLLFFHRDFKGQPGSWEELKKKSTLGSWSSLFWLDCGTVILYKIHKMELNYAGAELE